MEESLKKDYKEALAYAETLAMRIHQKHYSHITTWRPLPDLVGLLTQIDNMTCPLKIPPTHCQCTLCKTSEAWCRVEREL